MIEKIKLLIVCGSVTNGGIGSVIIKMLKNINFDKFDIYVTYYKPQKEGLFQEKIKKLIPKEKILVFKFSLKNMTETIKETRSIYENNHFDIMHSHCATLSLFHFYFAKKYGVKTRIMHSHSTMFAETKLKSWRNLLTYNLTKPFITDRFSCGKDAGVFLFKRKPFDVINNAIDCQQFQFNEEWRSEIRNEFNLSEDAFVLGHISNFAPVKNHSFIIDVFNEVYKQDDNSHLLLVGEGETFQLVKDKVKELGLEKQVTFAGVRSAVYRFYSAMDCFVFPSLFEGLPLTLVEAQASGLPCVISDRIADEVMISDIIQKLSLDNIVKWVEQIRNLSEENFNRKVYVDVMQDKGYDMRKEVKKLEEIYIKQLENISINYG